MQRVTRDQLCTTFSADNPPALRVRAGDTFVMETNDRFATYEGPDSSPEAMEILRTMAGPVYIEGAKAGDTLKIEVLKIDLPLPYGWIGATPGDTRCWTCRCPRKSYFPKNFSLTIVRIFGQGW